MKIKKIFGISITLSGMFLTSCEEFNHIHDYENASDSAYHWIQCSTCGEIKEKSKVLHNFVDNEEKVDENKTATCTEQGYVWQVCECGKEKQRPIEKVEHNFNIVASTTATCEEAGENTMRCSMCGKEGDLEPQDALGHTWVKDVNQNGTIASTCLLDGTVNEKCSRCETTRTTKVVASGHDFTSMTVGKNVTRQLCKKCDELRFEWMAISFSQYVTGSVPLGASVSGYMTGKGIKILNEGSSASYDITTNLAMGAPLVYCAVYFENLTESNDNIPEELNFKCDVIIDNVSHSVSTNVQLINRKENYGYYRLVDLKELNEGNHTIKFANFTGEYDYVFNAFGIEDYSKTYCLEEHEWEEITESRVEPTCTLSGRAFDKCKICGKEREKIIRPLEHIWADSEDTSENINPTCATEGAKKQMCTREGCNETQMVSVEKLTHIYKNIGTLPKTNASNATVYIEQCEIDNICRYRIDAKDVSETTKTPQYGTEPNYVENSDGSVSFWGRPYHNSLELDENGEVVDPLEFNSEIGADYYDASITGSFLEYKFEVGTNGIKGDLVCEISPNKYLSGSLFRNETPGDWTPGIMNADGELSQTRYIVEVDGIILEQDLSLDTTNIVAESNWGLSYTQRKSLFKFPLVEQLNLVEGEHTIRFIMGTGFIPHFYNIYIQETVSH